MKAKVKKRTKFSSLIDFTLFCLKIEDRAFVHKSEGEDEFKEKRFFSRLISDSTDEVLITS